MRVAAVAVVVVLALLASGCGSNKRRDAMVRYIDSVNLLQTRLAPPLLEISKANLDFAKHKAKPDAIAHRLRGAAVKVDALRKGLAALHPPPDGARLQPLLVEVAGREAALAREVASIVTFLPAYSKALLPLTAASKTLGKALRSKLKPRAKAAALDAYAAAIGGVLVQLRTLRAPPAFAALYTNQVATLEQVRSSGSALAQALRAKRAKNLAVLLQRFNRAAVANRSLPAQRAQIAAIRAYDDRIKAIGGLEARVTREQARLQKLLG